ncbi:hypothetical protein QUF72_19430, partial [Desulfobacterales bacterium HSG2]|nr:hypothetical protein [Desulfobacterales bacterium HSG2]
RACLVLGGDKPPAPGNRMREILTSGSVGGASGNRRIYPETDGRGASVMEGIAKPRPPLN